MTQWLIRKAVWANTLIHRHGFLRYTTPTNLPIDARLKWKRVEEARTPEERLAALEDYLSAIPAHHGTEKLRLQISKQIAKLRQELRQGEKKKGKHSYGIKRIADLLCFLIGPPYSGKSEFLLRWTGGASRKDMGVADLGGMKVQVVELPSVVPGQRGKPQPVMPDLVIVFLTKEYRDADAIIGAYGRYMLDLPRIAISKDGIGGALPFDVDLRELEKVVVHTTGIRRIYLKSPQEKQADKKPMIFRSEVTVGEVAEALHRSLAENFKYARVWGSVAYQGQKVGKSYKLSDGDIIEIHA